MTFRDTKPGACFPGLLILRAIAVLSSWNCLAVFLVNKGLPFFGCWTSFEGFILRCLGSGGLAEFLVLGMRLGLLVVFGAVVYALLCRALRVREMAYALNLLHRLKAYVAS